MAKYIDKEALLKTIFPYDVADKSKYAINAKAVEKATKGASTADVVEVVRCKDCKYFRLYQCACIHPHFNGIISVDGFCSYGERKEQSNG